MNNIGLQRNTNAAQAKNIQIGVVPKMESILVYNVCGRFVSSSAKLECPVVFLCMLSSFSFSMPPVKQKKENC